MLHVRVDERLKAQAADALSNVGLSLSDAVRILLTRIAAEGGLSAGLTADPAAYDEWFRTKVREGAGGQAPDQAAQSGDARGTGAGRWETPCLSSNGKPRRSPI